MDWATLRKHSVDDGLLYKKHRIRKHIQVIQDMSPDIVCFQEITPSIISTLKQHLLDYDASRCFAQIEWKSSKCKKNICATKHPINGNAIFVRKGTFASMACEKVYLDKWNQAALITGKLKNGELIKIVSLHLEWNDPKTASKQFRSLFDCHAIKKTDKHVIIAGDFNMGGHNAKEYPIISALAKHKFVDILNGVRTHPFTDDRYPSISHILLRNARVLEKGVGHANSIKECLELFGSDHFPIYADIIIE